jgi:hypothetical protein
MKRLLLIALLCCSGAAFAEENQSRQEMLKQLIPTDDYFKKSVEINKLRQTRQVSTSELLGMLDDKNTVILDVRGDEDFRQMHIRGSKHLSLSDMTAATLAKAVPSKTTRIVLYCDTALIPYPTRRVAVSAQAYPLIYQHGYEILFEVGQLWKSDWFSLPNKDEAGMRRQYGDYLKIPFEGDLKTIEFNRDYVQKALERGAAK